MYSKVLLVLVIKKTFAIPTISVLKRESSQNVIFQSKCGTPYNFLAKKWVMSQPRSPSSQFRRACYLFSAIFNPYIHQI